MYLVHKLSLIFHGYVANSDNDQLLAGLEAQVLRGCVVCISGQQFGGE